PRACAARWPWPGRAASLRRRPAWLQMFRRLAGSRWPRAGHDQAMDRVAAVRGLDLDDANADGFDALNHRCHQAAAAIEDQHQRHTDADITHQHPLVALLTSGRVVARAQACDSCTCLDFTP